MNEWLRTRFVHFLTGIKAPPPFFVTNFDARQEIANEAKQAKQSHPVKAKKPAKPSHPVKAKMTVDEPPKKRGRPFKNKGDSDPPTSTTKSTVKSTAKSIPKSVPKKTPPETVSTRQQVWRFYAQVTHPVFQFDKMFILCWFCSQPQRQSKLLGPLFRSLREDLYD